MSARDIHQSSDCVSRIVVPLFPLPSLVLFPQVVQALHVFEPRYRAMVQQLKQWKNSFALAVLQPGWTEDYEGEPAIYSTVCLCKVLKCQRRGDGTFDLLVAGTTRARVISETRTELPFRQASVLPCNEVGAIELPANQGHLGRKLLSCCDRRLSGDATGGSPLNAWIRESLSLHVLTDLLGYTLPLEIACKQQLLAECNVERRARKLISLLEAGCREPSVSDAFVDSGSQFSFN